MKQGGLVRGPSLGAALGCVGRTVMLEVALRLGLELVSEFIVTFQLFRGTEDEFRAVTGTDIEEIDGGGLWLKAGGRIKAAAGEWTGCKTGGGRALKTGDDTA